MTMAEQDDPQDIQVVLPDGDFETNVLAIARSGTYVLVDDGINVAPGSNGWRLSCQSGTTVVVLLKKSRPFATRAYSTTRNLVAHQTNSSYFQNYRDSRVDLVGIQASDAALIRFGCLVSKSSGYTAITVQPLRGGTWLSDCSFRQAVSVIKYPSTLLGTYTVRSNVAKGAIGAVRFEKSA